MDEAFFYKFGDSGGDGLRRMWMAWGAVVSGDKKDVKLAAAVNQELVRQWAASSSRDVGTCPFVDNDGKTLPDAWMDCLAETLDETLAGLPHDSYCHDGDALKADSQVKHLRQTNEYVATVLLSLSFRFGLT